MSVLPTHARSPPVELLFVSTPLAIQTTAATGAAQQAPGPHPAGPRPRLYIRLHPAAHGHRPRGGGGHSWSAGAGGHLAPSTP